MDYLRQVLPESGCDTNFPWRTDRLVGFGVDLTSSLRAPYLIIFNWLVNDTSVLAWDREFGNGVPMLPGPCHS